MSQSEGTPSTVSALPECEYDVDYVARVVDGREVGGLEISNGGGEWIFAVYPMEIER